MPATFKMAALSRHGFDSLRAQQDEEAEKLPREEREEGEDGTRRPAPLIPVMSDEQNDAGADERGTDSGQNNEANVARRGGPLRVMPLKGTGRFLGDGPAGNERRKLGSQPANRALMGSGLHPAI